MIRHRSESRNSRSKRWPTKTNSSAPSGKFLHRSSAEGLGIGAAIGSLESIQESSARRTRR